MNAARFDQRDEVFSMLRQLASPVRASLLGTLLWMWIDRSALRLRVALSQRVAALALSWRARIRR